MKVSDRFIEGKLGVRGDIRCGSLEVFFRDIPIKCRGVKCGKASNGCDPLSGVAPHPFQCLCASEGMVDANFDLSDSGLGKVVPRAMWNDLLLFDAILVAHFTESSMDFFECVVQD